MNPRNPRKRRRFAGLDIAWDASALPFDPFESALPLQLTPEDAQLAYGTGASTADLVIRATLATAPAPSPELRGAQAMLFHGTTRCFATGDGLVLWDGASTLRICRDGRQIDAQVHSSSLERAFHFSSVTVMMTLLLALRHHGLFHLHAAAARGPDGRTWLVPGESGSGKSTLALAAFGAGAQWLSDDALLLRTVDGALEVVGWARMMRMTSLTATAFPALHSLLERCPQGSAREWEVDPRRAFVGRGLTQARAPFTLLFPRITERGVSSIAALDRAEAFGRILHACAWVASEHVPRRQEQLDALTRLIDGAPAFDLALGTDLLREPGAAIAEITRQIGVRPPSPDARR